MELLKTIRLKTLKNKNLVVNLIKNNEYKNQIQNIIYEYLN
jgi:hypothetical protein